MSTAASWRPQPRSTRQHNHVGTAPWGTACRSLFLRTGLARQTWAGDRQASPRWIRAHTGSLQLLWPGQQQRMHASCLFDRAPEQHCQLICCRQPGFHIVANNHAPQRFSPHVDVKVQTTTLQTAEAVNALQKRFCFSMLLPWPRHCPRVDVEKPTGSASRECTGQPPLERTKHIHIQRLDEPSAASRQDEQQNAKAAAVLQELP